MYRQILLTTCISFFIIGVYYGHTEPWPYNDNLPSSVYADVHGSGNNDIVLKPKGHTTEIHVHCIGFAHWDRRGYYTIACEAKRTEKGKENWTDNDFEDEQDLKMDDFRDGLREIVEINTSIKSDFFTSDYVTWKGSATVVDETTGFSSIDFMKDGVRGHRITFPEAGEVAVPDRPAGFNLRSGRTSIHLRWEDSPDNGGSEITDYEYQYRYRLTQTRWDSWSEWKSAGKDNYELITGLKKNRLYSVRMRAVNSVGNSSVTGIKFIGMKQSR